MSRLPLYVSLPSLIGLSHTVHAAEQPAAMNFAGSLAQMVLGLGIVVALLLFTLWLIKRLSAPRGAAAGLKVLGAVAVGARERVVLVEIADTVLVLGVTAGSVCTLHTLEAAQLPQADNPGKAGDPPCGGDFAGWLKKSLERRGHEK